MRSSPVSAIPATPAALALEAVAIELTLRVALANRVLLVEYDRVAGTCLSQRRSALEQAIDEATGRSDGDLRGFLAFAKNVLWDRADDATREAVRSQVRQQLHTDVAEC